MAGYGGVAKQPLLGGSPPPLLEVARAFLVFGCTAFGGPPVHLSMFQAQLVNEKAWLSQARYMELLAMANCLPGPSSTQVAFAIGITLHGVPGGLVSGFAFLLPGAFAMTALGFASHSLAAQVENRYSAANAVAASASAVGVALVFIAVAGLVKKVVAGQPGGGKLAVICFGTAAVCTATNPTPPWLNPVMIVAGGAATALWPTTRAASEHPLAPPVGKLGLPLAAAVLVFALYLGLASWTIYKDSEDRGWLMPFLTAGMFVWGGGPVVLPMLMTVLTPTWVDGAVFLTGIALAEMMPGPVFNLACFLGAQLSLANGFPWLLGTFLCWAGLMGPGIALVFGALPLWEQLRSFTAYSRALPGLNAAAVGLLVSTVFVVYSAMEARSPWPSRSRAMALCAYAAVEHGGLSVPPVVLVASALGLLVWAASAEGGL